MAIKTYEELQRAAPDTWSKDFVDTAYYWRAQPEPVKRRKSGQIEILTDSLFSGESGPGIAPPGTAVTGPGTTITIGDVIKEISLPLNEVVFGGGPGQPLKSSPRFMTVPDDDKVHVQIQDDILLGGDIRAGYDGFVIYQQGTDVMRFGPEIINLRRTVVLGGDPTEDAGGEGYDFVVWGDTFLKNSQLTPELPLFKRASDGLLYSRRLQEQDAPRTKFISGAAATIMPADPVAAVGSVSGELSVDLALAGTLAKSWMIGVADEDGAYPGQFGAVVRRGPVNLDTSAYTGAAGSPLWLQPAGGLNTTKPATSNSVRFVNAGTLLTKAEEGKIYVDPLNFPFLHELSGVEATASPINGASLIYDSALGKWTSDKAPALFKDVFAYLSTGILTGGKLSINADPTKFNLSAGSGLIVDNWTDPANPTLTRVSWPAYTGVTDNYLATADQTAILVNSSGAIVQAAVPFSSNDYHDYIVIGYTIHGNRTSLNSTSSYQGAISSMTHGALDLQRFMGPLVQGAIYTANGANLNLNRSSGFMFRTGAGYNLGYKDPNVVPIALASPSTFVYRYRNGAGGYTVSAITTTILPAAWDDGSGTLATALPNKWTNQRVYVGASGLTVIVPGQTVYNSLAEASAAIQTESVMVGTELADLNLRTVLTVKSNATTLNSAANALFTPGGLFGVSGSGGASFSAPGDGQNSVQFNDAGTFNGVRNVTTAKQFLAQTGDGTNALAPVFSAIAQSDVTGLTTALAGKEPTITTLPATKGGTGNNVYAVGDLLYANTTTTLARLADVATGSVLRSGGVGVAPAWGKVALGDMATLPANTFIGNNTGSAATPLALTVAQMQAALGGPFSSAAAGLAWMTPVGVFGPPSFRAIDGTDLPFLEITIGSKGLTQAMSLPFSFTLAEIGAAPAFSAGTPNLFWATPSAGSGMPALRSIDPADIPTLNQSTTGSAGTLATPRTLTIGATGKAFNGSADVAWSLSEIFSSASGNLFWATPNGAPGLPSLRALFSTDIPSLDASKITTGRFTPSRLPASSAQYLSDIADPTGILDASSAISSILATGKPLIVDAGTYKIGAQIVIPSGAQITFQRGGSFFQPNSVDYAKAMLLVESVSGVVIENPVLTGSITGTTPGAAINDAIRITGCSNVRVEFADCSGFQGNGIRVNSGSSGISLVHPICHDNKQNGILVSDSPDCRISDPECYSNGTSSLEHGIYVSGNSGVGSAKLIISGIPKTYSNSGSGIQVSKISTDVVIGDVQTYSNGTNGINIATDTGATEMTISIGNVRSFNNALRGFYIQQGTAVLRMTAGKLCAYGNGREGVYFEGLTAGFDVTSVDSYLNGRDGLRIKDSAGTAIRDGLIGTARCWDNSQEGDGLYDGITIESGIRCSIGVASVRSTNPALRHNYGVRVSGTSQLTSISSGEIYGSKLGDFADTSAALSTVFGAVVTGDASFPASKSSYTTASSAVALTGTLATVISSPTLPAGRYAVTCNFRAYNSLGTGRIEAKIIADGADKSVTGAIDIQTGIRISICVTSVFTLAAAGTIDLRARFLSGACDVAERSMTVVKI